MYLINIWLITVIVFLAKVVHGTYPLTINDGSLKVLPSLHNTASVVYNDVIYTYGGKALYQENATDGLYSYTLNQTTGEMVVSLVSLNEGPICTTCSTVIYPNTSEIWIFAEPIYHPKSQLYQNSTFQKGSRVILPHIYNIEKKSWTVLRLPTLNGNQSTFYGRARQTTVLGNDGTVYVLGGIYQNETAYLDDTIHKSQENLRYQTVDSRQFTTAYSSNISEPTALSYITDGWYYNKTENSYNVMRLPTDNPYIDSLGFINIDGNLGFFAGCNSTNYKDVMFYSGNILNMYDISKKTWGITNLKWANKYGRYTSAGATLQVDYDRKLLYTFGGKDIVNSQSYIDPNFYVIDLVNNLWLNSKVLDTSEPPGYIYGASSALIMNNSYFVRLTGIEAKARKDIDASTVDLLELSFTTPFDNAILEAQKVDIKWINTIIDPPKETGMSVALIFAILMCSITFIIVIIALLIAYGRACLPVFWTNIKLNILWCKREGEPNWIEISRTITRFLSVLVLIIFLSYNINNVITSPISQATIVENVDSITVPDFRLCFSGWRTNNIPSTSCIYGGVTDFGCSLKRINTFNYTPSYPNELAGLGLMACFLYAPSVQPNVTNKNKSLSISTNGYTYGNNEAIYLQLYRPDEDVNRILFLNEELPGVSPAEIQDWPSVDTKSPLQVVAYPNSYTLVTYQDITYKDIKQDITWNYFGISPVYSTYTNLSISYNQPLIPNQARSNNEGQYFFNSIILEPKSFTKIIMIEKRDKTILDIFGSIGGIFSLVFGLQIFLFGTRPTRPWGFIHRQVGKYKTLSDGLDKCFNLREAQIPFVSPLHQRFKNISHMNFDEKQMKGMNDLSTDVMLPESELLENRVDRLEARNQLLEMVLRSYYIDDEIFFALDYARRRSERYPETVIYHLDK